jgi:hypothetical protein
MILHTDIPTRADIAHLWSDEPGLAVSLYLETDPASPGELERIAYKNAVKEALAQLEGADKRQLAALADELEILEAEGAEEFWQHQARSLAVFATPWSLRTYRLPNRLTPVAIGGSRFFVKPLLRAVTFPQGAFVLALAQGSVRLLEAVPDAPPREVKLDAPSDVADAVGKSSIKDRSPSGRLQGAEGQKQRMAQFSRAVDSALRAALPGPNAPLVLAATEPLESIFRAHATYPELVPNAVPGNPEGLGDGELVAAAREVLDAWYADELEREKATFEERSGQGRTSTDVAELGRLAVRGVVDTLFVDIDATVPGRVDDDGEVTFAADPADAGDVVDEIARRAWFSGARVLAVRGEDVPGGGDVAAVLRYAPTA